MLKKYVFSRKIMRLNRLNKYFYAYLQSQI